MTTEFQDSVYEITKIIPAGKVSTYGAIAKILNTSPRAVARALSRNTIQEVPCHRIVGSDGTLKGFFKETDEKAILKKKAILENEGVLFENRRVCKICFYELSS
eukprot:NODE_33_length_36935_cov_1.609241.p32 type:complete len:104 gc:universal NODE_33_length_36935_cov_1.609241:21386-21697(+)